MVEMLGSIAILSVIVGASVIGVGNLLDRNRVIRSAVMLSSDIEMLRSEAAQLAGNTSIERLVDGYRCFSDRPQSQMNLTRIFETGVSWSAVDEFAPVGSRIHFFRGNTPYSSASTLLTEDNNDLVIRVSDRSCTISISPITGMVTIRR